MNAHSPTDRCKLVCSWLLVLATLIVAPAQADTHFDLSFDYLEPDGPSPNTSRPNDHTIRWGTPNGPNDHPSSLSYTEYAVSTDYVLSGQPFACGSFRYENGTINSGTGISSAFMFFSVRSDNDDLEFIAPFPERMFTESTPNTGTPDQNADFLVFSTISVDVYESYFNVHENGWATADVIVQLDRLDLPIASQAAGSPPRPLRFVFLGFANVRGDGFLTDSPIGNRSPDCIGNGHRSFTLWPPNHQVSTFDLRALLNVTDPDGDPVTLTVTRITQDEPVDGIGDGDQTPDGVIVSNGLVMVRAERSGAGNGRVYNVHYEARDNHGGTCVGVVNISVPRNRGGIAIDDGQQYNSSSP